MTPGGVENGAIELAVLKIPYMDLRSCSSPSRSHFSPGLNLKTPRSRRSSPYLKESMIDR